MRFFSVYKDLGAAACLAVSLLPLAATGAMATPPIFLCVAETAGGAVKSGGAEGTCRAKYARVALPSTDAEQEKLLAVLPHVKFIGYGVGGKPTIQFSGVNVQVVSGAGRTNAAVNGEGNLVIGYDEDTGTERGHVGAQTGSHNLILGEEQEFTSYGGIVAGYLNNIRAPFASVLSGGENTASGIESVVLGGVSNIASWYEATVTGGARNTAAATESTVSGGSYNSALSDSSSVSGGSHNMTEGEGADWVGGGYKNVAKGLYSSIFGGRELTATNEFEAIP